MVYDNVRMITSSPTKRISAISQWKHLPEFYPQDGGESLLASRLRHCHHVYSRYTYFFLLAPSVSRPAWARTFCRYYGNNSLGLARRRETEFYQYFIKDIRRLHDGTAGGGCRGGGDARFVEVSSSACRRDFTTWSRASRWHRGCQLAFCTARQVRVEPRHSTRRYLRTLRQTSINSWHTIRDDARCCFNSWPTFSPYLYNRVWSELTCCNPLSHSRLACSRLSAHIEPSVNNPRRQTRPILRHELS